MLFSIRKYLKTAVNKQMAHHWQITERYYEWGLGMSSLHLEWDSCPVLFQEAALQTLVSADFIETKSFLFASAKSCTNLQSTPNGSNGSYFLLIALALTYTALKAGYMI